MFAKLFVHTTNFILSCRLNLQLTTDYFVTLWRMMFTFYIAAKSF